MPRASTAVSKKKKNGKVPVAFDPDIFKADAGAGVMDLATEDLAMPFLKLIQSTSTDILESSDDARPGDFYNNVTREVMKGSDGIRVINCAYRLEYLEWEPLGKGSNAPYNIYQADDALPETFRKKEEPGEDKDYNDYILDGNGRYLERTAQHFVLMLDDESMTQQALLSMKSTQFKKSKQWNSALKSMKMKDSKGTLFIPPRYAHIFDLKTTKEKNTKGNWWGWDISKKCSIEDPALYALAKLFAESIKAGEVKVQHLRDAAATSQTDDNVPF